MDFRLTAEQQARRDQADVFAREHVAPAASRIDESGAFPAALVAEAARRGYLGLLVPREDGGEGASHLGYALAIEAIARASATMAVILAVHNSLVTATLQAAGTEAQRRQWLRRLATGDALGAFALSEADAGTDAANQQTVARRTADGYAITGRKLWITNGNEADLFIVFANINPEVGYRGITGFLVDRGMPGFTVGKKEDKLGIRASSTCELLFEDCHVSRDRILGEVGKGYKVAIETLNEGRIGIGAQMIGLAQGALDHAVRYTKERKQFGKPIADFQGVQFQLARMAIDVESARLLVYNAARLRDAGLPFLHEAAICKIVSSEAAERVTSMAVNLYGGYGFVRDYPVEKLFRDAKIGQIYEGTSNMQLVTIAKQLLS
jgi:alkylation response protein AidB-like acyl-CoA dehydrogenase